MQAYRIAGVKEKTGQSESGIQRQVADGTFPPPVKWGTRICTWLDEEVTAVIAARAAGKSDDEIREIVRSLVLRRQKLADDLLDASAPLEAVRVERSRTDTSAAISDAAADNPHTV